MIRRIGLLLLLLIPLGMGACHYKWTAPFFWKHQSSFAAEMAFGGFFLIGLINFIVLGIIWSEWSRKP